MTEPAAPGVPPQARARFRGRREDLRLVTGAGRYTADWDLPGQLHAHFLRADRAHADITSLDTSAAMSLPGVVAVFTGADARDAGLKCVPTILRAPGRNGMALRNPFRSCLAIDRVRYVGQEVALVVAETAAGAQDAAERLVVDYADRPAVIGAAYALHPDAAQVHDDVPGNLALDFDYGDEARTWAAFADAAHVARIAVAFPRLAGSPMEPKSCLAAFDASSGTYHFYVPSQGSSMMQAQFAEVFGEAPAKIKVHSRDVGGGFGVRGEAYPEYIALGMAARALGRPIKWVGTRSESIQSDHHGRGESHTAELALDRDGNFLAIRVEWLVDLGAFCTDAGPFIHTIGPSGQIAGLYRTPVAYALHRLVFTNATPTTAYRGAARPNAAYVFEQLVEEAARVTGIDAVELRRRNVIASDAFPYRTPTGASYCSGDPAGLLDAVLKEADWDGFPARCAESRQRGKLRGRGVALFVEPSGGGLKDGVAIRFTESGHIEVFAPVGPSGQGSETVFPEIVAAILGVDAETVTLRYNDPDGPALVGMGSIGSRTLINHGGALSVAARTVVAKGLELAADQLEVAIADLAFSHGQYQVPGTDLSVSLLDLARRLAPGSLDADHEQAAVTAWPTGAHVAEIEIDAETGTLSVLRYVGVDDCGRLINPVIVEGQLHGGIVQGLGQGLGEGCVYDRETGQLVTASFMDYFMPRASDVPSFELYDRPTLSPTNPLGAKGAGEAGTTGGVPALAGAVLDALNRAGAPAIDMPYTPVRLWQAIRYGCGLIKE